MADELAAIEAFIAARRMPATRFGRAVARDPRFVLDLRAGRRLRPATRARVQAYLAEHGAVSPAA